MALTSVSKNAVRSALGSPAASAEILEVLDQASDVQLETEFLDDVLAGTAAASKAMVLDSGKGIGGITTLGSVTFYGSTFTSLGGTTAIGASGAATTIGGTVITIGGSIKTSVGVGAVVAGTCLASEGGDGVIHKTTLTLSLTGANGLGLADGDHGTGIKIYGFPAGSIQILGATCNAVVTSVNAEGGGATFPMALGSAVGADDNALTSTEADIIPSTAIAGGATKDFHATLAAPILFANAAGSDLDLYLNAACTDAVNTGAVTIAVTGTVTITWINLGDY